MTESELMTVMTAGMAHISGGIMAAYILFGVEAQHLLTAVIMTAPGTLMMAKIFVPETGQPETMGTVKLDVPRTDVNVIDAVGRGTGEGLHLALNVGAMLISFLALIALVNATLGLAGLSMQQIFGWVFAPLAWSMGVPWQDAATIGNLLGTRMVLNEFVAYAQLGELKATLDPRSFTIATFALCGFANFSSIGIQIGGIGALAPNRRHDLARLGIRAMLAGGFRTDRFRPELVELAEREPERLVSERGIGSRAEVRVRWIVRGTGTATLGWRGDKAKAVERSLELR
jgi:CNT family concentrative nucleoside transporter